MKPVIFTHLLALMLHPLFGQHFEPVLIDLPPGNFDYQNVSIVNADVVWALADSITFSLSPNAVPAIVRTTDGGANWDYIRAEEAVGRFAWSIQGLDEQTAIFSTNKFIPSDTRPVFKTTDAGLSWREITPPNSSGGVLLHFFDPLQGVAINRQRVSTTLDGGETWTLVPEANGPVFESDEFNLLYFSGNYSAQVGDYVWVGTNKGRVYRTSDRGYHWDMFTVSHDDDMILSIAFTDTLNGVATAANPNGGDFYENSRLFATADGGVTWTELDPAPMGDVTTLIAIPGNFNHYLAGSFLGLPPTEPNISLNYNGLELESWSPILLDSVYLNCGEFLDPSTGYVAAWSSRPEDEVIINGQLWNKNYIWKWMAEVDTKETTSTSPLQGVRIWPNPATDVIHLDGTTEAGKLEWLCIMDGSGRRLVDQSLGDASNTTIDIQQLMPGLYYVFIKTDKGIAVRKVTKL
ncbi:MAG TPA: T9SS type A sorting domain-containing protein [Saprospiraceae bacterium]|nr:T9SS type A sorting domain-containing protein [Saprospiraceae bacterium]HMQ84350.1 T9SS type A sorting domain-containing protein [Saprospiraceae bacterium]